MAFLKRSKWVLFAGIFSPALLAGFAVAGQPAVTPENAGQRPAEKKEDSRREQAMSEKADLIRKLERAERELERSRETAERLQREVERFKRQQRPMQRDLDAKHLDWSWSLSEPANIRKADFERSHPLDGQGWRVDAHGIIRDRSWRPVGNWGTDDAIGLWGVDDDGSLNAR